MDLILRGTFEEDEATVVTMLTQRIDPNAKQSMESSMSKLIFKPFERPKANNFLQIIVSEVDEKTPTIIVQASID